MILLHYLFSSNIVRQPKRELVPRGVLSAFQKQFEEPSTEEGFTDIKQINWVFRGSDIELQRWSMWLSL